MGSSVQLDRTVKDVEGLLLHSLQAHFKYNKLSVFGVVCVTCDDLKDSSLTIKLNKEILKDVSVDKELNSPVKTKEEALLPFVRSSFRKRSFSADGNLPKIRTPQVRRLQTNRPSSAGVLLDESPSRPSAFYKPTTPRTRKYELPKSPLLQDAGLENSSDIIDSFDTGFKAVTTGKEQRELLEKTLKEFIKIKYQQSVSGKDYMVSPPPNPKISPMSTDFLKLLSLQARIMGVPIPAGLGSASNVQQPDSPRKTPGRIHENSMKSPLTEKKGENLQRHVAIDSLGKETSVSGALGITKHKKLSFVGNELNKYHLEQGQFARAMHDKLAGVKQFVPEENEKKNKATSPTRTDKRSAKSDKRKQVLKKQHALRVANELKNDHAGDCSKVINDLSSVPQIQIKDEKTDDGYDMAVNSSVLNDMNENCLIKGAADISEMEIKSELEMDDDNDMCICLNPRNRYGNINDGNNSIHLPPSAYVFKPIIISPKVTGSKKVRAMDDSKTTDDDSGCMHSGSINLDIIDNEDTSNQSSMSSCTCDISNAEHSFVPRESLSSLQVEDETDNPTKDEDVDANWKVLPFADVENIPDEVLPEKKFMADKLPTNRSHETGGLKITNEDSNFSNISMDSVGFDIQSGYSPGKVPDGDAKTAPHPNKPLCEGSINKTDSTSYMNQNEQVFNIPGSDVQKDLSHGLSLICKSSLEALTMTLSSFSPVKCDQQMVKTKDFAEELCGRGVSPIRGGSGVVVGNSCETRKNMTHTSTPKAQKHPVQEHVDHSYTYKSRLKGGKVSKDIIRKRKPQKTKKFFPLMSYLAGGKDVDNIETEVVSMDDIHIVTEIYPKVMAPKPSKKRQISGRSNTSESTASKRIKCDVSESTKPQLCIKSRITSEELPKKQVIKPIVMKSTKKPPIRPPFRSVSNEAIIQQNKRTDLMIHKPEPQRKQFSRTPKKVRPDSTVGGRVNKSFKIKNRDKVRKTPYSVENKFDQQIVKKKLVSSSLANTAKKIASLKEGLMTHERVNAEVQEESVQHSKEHLLQKDGFHITEISLKPPHDRFCIVKDHPMSEKTDCIEHNPSSEASLETVPTDTAENLCKAHQSSFQIDRDSCDLPSLQTSETVPGPSIIVSLPIEQIFRCNKLNLVTRKNLQKSVLVPEKKNTNKGSVTAEVEVSLAANETPTQMGETESEVEQTSSPHRTSEQKSVIDSNLNPKLHTRSIEMGKEVFESKRAKSVSPYRSIEQNPNTVKTITTQKDRAKSVSPYSGSDLPAAPKLWLDKSKSAEDLSSLLEVHSGGGSTDGAGHLLVRAAPTQYSSPRLARSSRIKNKFKSLEVIASVINEPLHGVQLGFSASCHSDNVRDIRKNTSSTRTCLTAIQENNHCDAGPLKVSTPQNIKKHKHKQSSGKKLSDKLSNSVNRISATECKSSLFVHSSDGSLLSGDIQTKCLQPNSNSQIGKGRAGKKRTDFDCPAEGFKMKKHWLEMYGPVSPFPTVSSVTPDDKENY